MLLIHQCQRQQRRSDKKGVFFLGWRRTPRHNTAAAADRSPAAAARSTSELLIPLNSRMNLARSAATTASN